MMFSSFLNIMMIYIEFIVGMVVHHMGDTHSCLGRVEKSFHTEHVKMTK